jgi:hypothetical protein
VLEWMVGDGSTGSLVCPLKRSGCEFCCEDVCTRLVEELPVALPHAG